MEDLGLTILIQLKKSILPSRRGVLPNRVSMATIRNSVGGSNTNTPGRQPIFSRGPTAANVFGSEVVYRMKQLSIDDDDKDDSASIDKRKRNIKLLMNLNHSCLRPSTVISNIVSSTTAMI